MLPGAEAGTFSLGKDRNLSARYGALVLLLPGSTSSVSHVFSTDSVVHTYVSDHCKRSFLLSTIYGSTNPVSRKVNSSGFAWLLVGDFHCILGPADKRGGRPFVDSRSSRSLQSLIFEQDLVDLGFSGPRFTWNNNRSVLDMVQVRLDRAFGNPNFVDCYPDLSIKHLVRTGSDHNPLLLTSKNFSRLFRFEHFFHMVIFPP